MRRRAFLASMLAAEAHAPVRVPVLRLRNKLAPCSEAEFGEFVGSVWREAEQEFRRCGVVLDVVERECEIRKYPSGRPLFTGLERGVVNVVLTGDVPLDWDNGRGLAGLSTIYEGCHLCLIAVHRAHGNRAPWLAVNTVVHELLHLFLGDVFVPRPGTWDTHTREASVDWHATRMWLLGRDATVGDAAREYVRKLG